MRLISAVVVVAVAVVAVRRHLLLHRSLGRK
jgi:hypothetical protein